MNCQHVQELLPLYVGRDLEATHAQMVTEHLQSCEECAGSADDYRDSRQLLQQFAPPPFSETVYAGIRQHVLREIERESTKSITPILPNFVASLFRPRIRWAVATVAVLAVSVFAFYFIANYGAKPMNGQQQVADSGRTVDGPTSSSIKKSAGLPLASPVQKGSPVQGLAGGTHQYQRRKGPAAAAARTRPATINSGDERSLSAQRLPNGNNRSEPDAVPASDSAASGKTLRMEMQTKDPNIRIIWFSHQPTKQDSPGKFSKGT